MESAATVIISPVAGLYNIVPSIRKLSSPESKATDVAELLSAPSTVMVRLGSSSLKWLYFGSSVDSDEAIASNACRGAEPLGSKRVKSSR